GTATRHRQVREAALAMGRTPVMVLLYALACAPLGAMAAQPPPAPTFTPEQAEAGRATYARHCAICHGTSMEGGMAGPALQGSAFVQKWGNRWQQLFEQTRRTMP